MFHELGPKLQCVIFNLAFIGHDLFLAVLLRKNKQPKVQAQLQKEFMYRIALNTEFKELKK